MELWEKIKKGLSEGYEFTKDGVTLFLEKTGEMTQIAQLRIKILGIHRKIRENFFEIGGRLYEIAGKKDVDVLKDEKIAALLEEVKKFEKEVEKTEKEIEKIKEEEKKE